MPPGRAIADVFFKRLAEILHIDWLVTLHLYKQQIPIQVRDPALSLVSLAIKIIDLRLQRGDFGVPHSWTHRGGDGVSKAGKDRHRISVSEEAQERRKELPDERYPHSAGQSRPLPYRLSQKNNPGASVFPA